MNKYKSIMRNTKMKKSLISLLIVLVTLVGFISCSEAEEANASALPKSVTIGLEGIPRQGSKTILPAEVETPDKYDVTLTPMNLVDDQWVADETAKQNFAGLEADGQANLTLREVKLGTYQVSITAYNKNDAVIMTGTTDSENLLKVTASGANNITIALKLISSGDYTGNIEVVFDWTDAYSKNSILKEATDNGTLSFQLLMKQSLSDNSAYEVVDTQSPQAGETTFTFTSTALPVTPDGMIYFKVFSGEQLLVNNFKVAVAQIYAGHTSTPDANEADVFIIRNSDITKAKNVSNVKSTIVDNKPVITWENVTDRSGNNVLSKVVLTFIKKTADGEQALDPITVTLNEDEATGSYTFDTAEPNVKYGLKIQAFHTSGYASSNDDTDLRIVTETKVTEIKITEGVPTESIALGSNFTLTVEVLPEIALNKDYTWSFNENVFSVAENTFTATGIGSSVITVTADGNTEVKATTPELKVILAAPQNVSAELTENDGIVVSWDASEKTASYDVYRSINGEAYTAISNVTDTTYSDKDIDAGKNYSYKVVAVYDDTAYNSAESEESETVEVQGTVINITSPEIVGQTISFGDTPDVNYVMADRPFSITVDGIDGATSYKWYVDTEFSIESQTFEINADSEYFDSTVDNPSITLMLEVKTPNDTYSKSITIYLITEKDGAVTLDFADPSKNNTRLSNITSDGSARTVQLVADVETNNDKIIYFYSDNTSLATVDKNGLVTFNKDATDFSRQVTITASSAFGTQTASITFDVYKPTVLSQEQLLKTVNNTMRTHLESANAKFDNDWFQGNNRTTTWNDVDNVTASNTRGVTYETTKAYIEYANYIFDDSEIGSGIILTGKIEISIHDSGNYSEFFGADNKPSEIGSDSQKTLTVALPYNQGTATIIYNKVKVYGTESGGSYSISFNKSVGTDCYNEVEGSFRGESKDIDGADTSYKPYN